MVIEREAVERMLWRPAEPRETALLITPFETIITLRNEVLWDMKPSVV